MVVESYTPSVERTPDVFGVVTTQGREADLSKTRQFLVGDKARTRPVLKLAKRQDNLELSYLCSTFVLLKEWQGKDTSKARQGKKKRCRYDTTTRQGKSVYNLEMHDLQFGIVIPLSYLCSVEIITKSK